MMDEEAARAWVRERFGAASIELLERFVQLVQAESLCQNLIASSTQQRVWVRHVMDSAQLLSFADDGPGTWLDIGSGAGFPGVVVALLRASPIVLVEPRAKRANFLAEVVERLALSHVSVIQRRVEQVSISAAIISARAVAPLPELFASALGCSSPDTVWLLPKGRSAICELDIAKTQWRGLFHVEQSLTDSESSIIRASAVARR